MIVSAKLTMPSAKLLAKHLEKLGGGAIPVTSRVSKVVLHDTSIYLRYGNSFKLRQAEQWRETERNSAEDIKFLIDKRKVSERLLENGFISPKFVSATMPTEKDFPLIVRTTLTGSQGKGMFPCIDAGVFSNHWVHGAHWCSYISVKSEYRFFVYKQNNGTEPRIFRVSKKILREGATDSRKIKIRHNDLYKYSRRYEPLKKYPKMCKDVIRVSKLLPGRFFALDIGWSTNVGTVFFETNTAFGLDNGSAKQLAEQILEDVLITPS
jgi:hypothetical protein